MARLDAEGYVRAYLEASLPDAEVRASVPDPRPERLVLVWRGGGSSDAILLDRPGVHLLVWGPGRAAARELAERVRALMRALPRSRFLDGIARADEEAFRYDADPLAVPAEPRYFLSYTLTTFKY